MKPSPRCRTTRGALAVATSAALAASALAAAPDLTWSTVGDQLRYRASGHFAQLADGRLLLAGGMATDPESYEYESAHTALFDPSTGVATQAAPMLHPRLQGTATRLKDGRVLLAGGKADFMGTESQAHAELFDPRTETWVATSTPLGAARYNHTATLLDDGRVLLVGGFTEGNHCAGTAELFNPVSATFQSVNLTHRRNYHTATKMKDGRVLVVGGNIFGIGAIAEVEVFDPATDAFTPVASLPDKRWMHRAAPRGAGVLVTSGAGYIHNTTATVIYDPTKDRWREGPSLPELRGKETLLTLPDGRLFVFGGDDPSTLPSKARRTTWLLGKAGQAWTSGPELPGDRFNDAAFVQDDGTVLVVGAQSPVLRLGP